MSNSYKGVRITELLEDIALWQSILESSKSAVDSADQVIQVVEAEATMAIMKAKLTALQGDN
jgi:G:T/U-mismatch repair DNA glycosylase